ncbi:hypothetical protein HCN44_001674 [Aphidius gifuensis]|uniref:Nucleolar protein 14 n=1 Tax=Aphidius gifuensis TaxID=684658 RepID=A0A834XWD7_APHGI|nr:nucleolar protein 14 homolog [Aphidius gifuensis]KAF7992349.1 hypothetical protein HCN44_001674 [Aphidius gifuensis]
MGPTKSKRKPFENIKKKINPFEIHINRDKQNVLGRQSKADRGLPGVARSKALNKRKKTLLQEYNSKDKDNVFKDRRIGEKDFTMSFEEKAQARYSAELMKAHKKKNIYNLGEEVTLTHRGNTLEEIERFENPNSDDEDYDDDRGQLSKKFVSEAHFGGGIFTKADGNRDVLAELILESKKKKAEQQKTREDNIKKTEELDSTWKDLQALVVGSSKIITETEEKPKADDYDIAVNTLKYESRAQATDRLKTDEEIQKEENEKLKKFELDRLARMKDPLNDADSKSNHKSADHLDDGFHIEDIEEEQEDEILAYDDDGVMVGIKKKVENVEKNLQSDDEDDDDNDDDEEEEVDDEEKEEKDDHDDEEEEEEDDDDDDDDDEDDDDAENNLSDLKESDSSSDEDEDEEEDENAFKPLTQKFPKEKKSKKPIEEEAEEEEAEEEEEEEEEKTVEVKPSVQLTNTFEYHVRDVIKTTNAKTTDDIVKVFQTLDKICPQLYDLAQKNPQSTWTTIQEIMKEKHDKFEKNQRKYPTLDTLILFKIISLLFPTSDFRHPVVTPCIVFMSQILLRSKVKSKLDIAKGLFIATLMLEFTVLSKRFSPAVINFLTGIIYLSTVKKESKNLRKTFSPFKSDNDFLNSLVLAESQVTLKIQPAEPHMRANDLIRGDIDNDFKLRAFLTAINLLNEFKNNFDEIDAVHEIFEPAINLMKMNNYKNYPKNIRQYIKKSINEFAELKNKKLNYLVKNKNKPKALKLYEPKIETVYDGKRYRPMSKEKAEHEKLVHKVKREMKGAIREVRRDAAFIAKVQIQGQIKSDIIRKRKVKEIYGEGAAQQGELNQLKRKANSNKAD